VIFLRFFSSLPSALFPLIPPAYPTAVGRVARSCCLSGIATSYFINRFPLFSWCPPFIVSSSCQSTYGFRMGRDSVKYVIPFAPSLHSAQSGKRGQTLVLRTKRKGQTPFSKTLRRLRRWVIAASVQRGISGRQSRRHSRGQGRPLHNQPTLPGRPGRSTPGIRSIRHSRRS
jgi:hypothetical protein